MHILALLGLFFLGLAGIAFAFPLAKALAPAFSLKAPESFYNAKNIFYIFRYTLMESVCSTLIALVIGLPGAFFISQRSFLGKGLLRSFSALPLCMPALVTALGYIMAFGTSGYINKLFFLYSFTGIIITQGFYNFPLIMTTVANAWSSLDRTQEEAALLLGASPTKVFFTITIVRLLPSILSACVPVFLFCFFSFMIVLMFGAPGGTTFEVAIYHAGRANLDFTGAARLSIAETFSALGILFLWSLSEKKSLSSTGLSQRREREKVQSLGKKDIPFFAAFILTVTVFFVLPFASIIISSLNVQTWKNVFSMPRFLTAILNTLTIGAVTSVFSTAAALSYALLTMNKKNQFLKSVLPMLPMAVSSVVMGIGFAATFKRSSPLTLILAQTALYWPFAYRQIKNHLEKIPPTTRDAALILSETKLDALFKVYIPYAKRGIIHSLALTLALSAGDATLPLVLALPNFTNIPLMTYALAGSYRLPESCVCALILGAICMTLFSLTQNKGSAK